MIYCLNSERRPNNRSQLKNAFWPPAFFGGIGASFQILDNQQVASGLKLGSAAPVSAKPLFSGREDGTLNQNPVFEMGSRNGFYALEE